jgi:pyruvate,water dikinase
MTGAASSTPSAPGAEGPLQHPSTAAPPDDPFVVPLDRVGASDVARVGGKATNLGELIRAGLNVPPGFAISTTAYDAVVAANGLDDASARATATDDSAALAAGFARATIPEPVADAILRAYRRLGGGAVAVRSSATAEDLPDAAFAGQQETFLGIADEAALLEAVKGCWASLWSERAVAYRRRQGFSDADVKLAVVIQRMAPAAAAGVMFTANPVTGARNETVVDASAGLGESVVAGLVTPDHYRLRHGRRGWRIVERTPGRRELEVRARAGGGTEQIHAAARTGTLLSDATLRRLAAIGARIASHFGRPQDVEWAVAGGEVYVLQSRPITALPAPSRRGRFRLPPFAADYLQVRPYPLDITTWMRAMDRALPRMFPVDGLVPSFERMWNIEDGVVERFKGWPDTRLSPRMLLAPFRVLSLARRFDPAHWREDPVLVQTEHLVRRLESRDLSALSWEELLAVVREAMTVPAAVIEVRRRYFARGALALAGLRLSLILLGRGDRFATLLSGVDNQTLAANRALERLAAEVRDDPALVAIFDRNESAAISERLQGSAAGERFMRRVAAFLGEFGHRETGSPLLVSQPAWRDTPDTVLGIVQGLARSAPARPPDRPAWEAARDRMLAHPLLRLPPLRALFLALLREARRLVAFREDTHFLMTLPLPVLRRTLIELGRRLAAVGILQAPEDVFHLTFAELERAGAVWPPPSELAAELRSAAERRAARREALAGTPLMELHHLAPPTPRGKALVAGTPGSPGVASGAVRVVPGAAAFGTLLPGEILVAPYTNPSWTPLFGRAAAVVVDTGGVLSHAAIVAREYGLPAVMGTGDGTRRLRDGQRVRVDGNRGLVFAADSEAATPSGPLLGD